MQTIYKDEEYLVEDKSILSCIGRGTLKPMASDLLHHEDTILSIFTGLPQHFMISFFKKRNNNN